MTRKNILEHSMILMIIILVLTIIFSTIVLAELATDNNVPSFSENGGVVDCFSNERCAYWFNQDCGDANCFSVTLYGRTFETEKNCDFTDSSGNSVTRCDKVDECSANGDCVGIVAQCPNNAYCAETNSGFKYCECNVVNDDDNADDGGAGDGAGDGAAGAGDDGIVEEDSNCPWRSVIDDYKYKVIDGSSFLFRNEEGKVWVIPYNVDNQNNFIDIIHSKILNDEPVVFHHLSSLDGLKQTSFFYSSVFRSMCLFLFDNGNLYFGKMFIDENYDDGFSKLKVNKGRKLTQFSDVEQVTISPFADKFGLICALNSNGNVGCINNNEFYDSVKKQYFRIFSDYQNIGLSNVKKIELIKDAKLEQKNRILNNQRRFNSDKTIFKINKLTMLYVLTNNSELKEVVLNSTITYQKQDKYFKPVLDEIPIVVKNEKVIRTNVEDFSRIRLGYQGIDVLYDDGRVENIYWVIDQLGNPKRQVLDDVNNNDYNNDGFLDGLDDIASFGEPFIRGLLAITCDGRLKYVGYDYYFNAGINYYSPLNKINQAVYVGKPMLKNITTLLTTSNGNSKANYVFNNNDEVYFWGAKLSNGYIYKAIPIPVKLNYVLES